jgi:hypothetical protein
MDQKKLSIAGLSQHSPRRLMLQVMLGALSSFWKSSLVHVSIRYSERLAEAGIEPSVGSKGDSYDNALAGTVNGLYKAEGIHRRSRPTHKSVELTTLERLSCFNHQRLLEPIGCIKPQETEENCSRHLASQTSTVVAWLEPTSLHDFRGGSGLCFFEKESGTPKAHKKMADILAIGAQPMLVSQLARWFGWLRESQSHRFQTNFYTWMSERSPYRTCNFREVN